MKMCNTFAIPSLFLVKILKTFFFFFFASLIMKNIVVPSARSRFPVKLSCCIAFG